MNQINDYGISFRKVLKFWLLGWLSVLAYLLTIGATWGLACWLVFAYSPDFREMFVEASLISLAISFAITLYINIYGIVKIKRKGNEISERYYSVIYDIYKKSAAGLILQPPKLYCTLNVGAPAQVSGYGIPKLTVININNNLLSMATKKELKYVFCHEFGHLLHGDTFSLFFATLSSISIICLGIYLFVHGLFAQIEGMILFSSFNFQVFVITLVGVFLCLIFHISSSTIGRTMQDSLEYGADIWSVWKTKSSESALLFLEKAAEELAKFPPISGFSGEVITDMVEKSKIQIRKRIAIISGIEKL